MSFVKSPKPNNLLLFYFLPFNLDRNKNTRGKIRKRKLVQIISLSEQSFYIAWINHVGLGLKKSE